MMPLLKSGQLFRIPSGYAVLWHVFLFIDISCSVDVGPHHWPMVLPASLQPCGGGRR